ncbi:hypothetical protein BLA34_23130 [Ralstonia solanacearum]|nr:hypothetical protein BLA34_23130 [Ralstonia solanacearum]
MKRHLIVVGDRTTVGGTVIEGVAGCSMYGKEASYVGAKVECPKCNSIGYISQVPPTRRYSLKGKQVALENDLCICGCHPPPTLIPSQLKSSMSFEAKELARQGFAPDGRPLDDATSRNHWIRFKLKDAGDCEGLRCRAHFADGTVEEGRFGSNGIVHLLRPNTSACEKVDISFDETPVAEQSVLESLLQAMMEQE